MSVPVWERGAFLGWVLMLLPVVAVHADENVINESSFAKTKPGQALNVSVHYKTVSAAQVAPTAVSPEATPAVAALMVNSEAGGAAEVRPLDAVAIEGGQPEKAPRFAKADEEAGRGSAELLRREEGVAIYDIEAGKVYLPNGETLEAHSGIGSMRDNPAFVDRRNRGPTPPDVYDLTMRETRFLGVEAIRLTPVGGEAAVFKRDGFLAHTYMLGRRGDSNGCVVFREYHRFLAAFKKGEIKRLVVVPRMKDAPASILSAQQLAKNG